MTRQASIEWAGIAKNVATLGFHARLATSSSRNDAGAFAAELFSEIWDYAETRGAQAKSFIGITGVGDLVTTVTAPVSRNARAGQLIGQGRTAAEAETRIKQAVESLHTVPLLECRIKHDTDTPFEALSLLSRRVTSNSQIQ